MADTWQRLKEVVAAALERPAAERAAFLDQACDGEARREAASLLGLEEAAADFIVESPVRRDEPEPQEPGDELGPYRLLRRLGSGGMGEVFLAERADGVVDQRVAIKVIGRGALAAELVDRFHSERQLLADLDHPNIAHLLGGGATDDGRPYLVMEYVEGEPIDRYCDERSLSVAARLRLFLKVCAAVEHAHRHLIIHRDLKPANVLVTGDGEPKLLDFGVAKDLGGGGKTPDTRFLVPLTTEYASPEQLAGGAATTAVDVYALGVVLYELLAGESPFGAGGDPLAGRSRAAPPSRPSTRIARRDGRGARKLRRRLAGDLDHIVLRALEPVPADRYPSVEQLARELERHLRGLPLESRGGVLYRLRKRVRRHWKALAAVAVASILGAGLVKERLERQRLEYETVEAFRESSDYLVDLFIQADPGITGERSEALEEMLDRGAELLRSGAFAGEPIRRAELLGAIGLVFRRQGRLDRAETLQRESLELRRQSLPADHEDIVVACNNLAVTLRDLGSYSKARTLLWEVRAILKRWHPGDHPDMAALLNNLAGVEKDFGHFDEAVELYREALEMKRRLPEAYGPRRLAIAVKNLGTGLRAAGRLDEAEAAFRRALAELLRLEKRSPAGEAGVEHHLGSLLRERGDLAAARELLDRAFDTRTELYGETHGKSLETALELALVDRAEGRLEVAEEGIRRVVEIRRDRLGDDHPATAEALVELAGLLGERGAVDGAVAAGEEALEIYRRRLPAGHWRIGAVEEMLARLRGR